jgi:hypothetical protein
MTRVEDQFEEQRASNSSGLPFYAAFAQHREHVRRLIVGEGEGGRERGQGRETERVGRVCVLGAGNAYDLDLDRLLDAFAEVHLADIDAAALGRARERVTEAHKGRVLAHAPLDLSGFFLDLERWGRMQVTAQELMAAPASGAKRVAAALPGPFDVVASTCLLTQLQLTLLEVLGDHHQLFGALREFLTLTHLRVLAALTKPGGRALLITDLCEASVFPPGRPRDDADLAPLMQELVGLGHVIHSSHPELIKLTLADDPVLRKSFDAAQLSAPWLWQNGPDRRFLCYAFTLPRV